MHHCTALQATVVLYKLDLIYYCQESNTFATNSIPMKIINPLYDKAFKYLMENERMAKKVISVILDEEVEELALSQQETVVPDEKHQLTLFRLDFKATIKNPDGTKHKVLIELQKSKFETDIRRFRAYLGSNYIKPDIEIDHEGREEKTSYPIITIYILGYKLDDVPCMAVTINPQTIDSVSKEILDIESDFIKQLNHKSHILQVRRLPENRKSRLEKFMVFFNQAWCTEQKYIIDLKDIPEEFDEIAKHLQKPVEDDAFRRQLEGEEEIDEIFDRQEEKYIRQIEEVKKKEAEERRQKEEAQLREKEALNSIKKVVISLQAKGMSVPEISAMIGKPENEVRQLLDS